jgi:hypothetical protein
VPLVGLAVGTHGWLDLKLHAPMENRLAAARQSVSVVCALRRSSGVSCTMRPLNSVKPPGVTWRARYTMSRISNLRGSMTSGLTSAISGSVRMSTQSRTLPCASELDNTYSGRNSSNLRFSYACPVAPNYYHLLLKNWSSKEMIVAMPYDHAV